LKVDTTITTIASSEPSTETSEAASTTKPSTTYSTVVITSTEEHGSGHNDTDNTTTTTTTTAKPPTKGNGNETKKDNGLADSTIAAISLAAAAAALALEEIFIGFIRKRLRRRNVVVPAANLPEAAQRPGPDEVVQIRQEEDEPPVVDEAVGVGGADLVEEAQLNPVIPEGNDDDIVPADEEREGEFGRVGRQHVPHLPRSVTGTELLPNRARLAPLPPTHLPPVRPVSVWTSVLNRVGSAFGSRETVADDGQWARPRDRSQSGITTSSSGDAMQMEDVGPNDHSEDQQVAGTRESRIGSPSSSATRRASSVVLEDGKSLKRSGKTDETGSRGST
jgi:hypothetical protein